MSRRRLRERDVRPLRLLHVFPQFATGGTQVRFASLAGALGDHFTHTVLALGGDYEAAAIVPPHARVRYLDRFQVETSLPRRLLQYRRLLRDLRPDLLATYNWGTIEFALARTFGGPPHLHHEDGFGPEEVAGQLPRRVWTRRLALAGSHVLVPSVSLERSAREVWRLAPRRVHYIPNGVTARAAAHGSLDALGLGLKPGSLRIAWIGALRPEKNPLRMLDAFAPLRGRADLLFIGEGPERGALEDKIGRLGLSGHVHLLGGRTDARDLLARCDILALSSDTEQMPLVVLEAMEAGLPVASVDVGDVGRMVCDENRPHVTPLSAPALGAALLTLAKDPALRRRIGEANRRRARAVYSHEAMVSAHRALLTQLAQTGRGAGSQARSRSSQPESRGARRMMPSASLHRGERA